MQGQAGAEKQPASALLAVDLQVENDVLARVQGVDGTYRRLGAFQFRVDLVIDIGIEAAEAVISRVIGKTAADRVGAQILQENDTAGQRIFALVAHNPMNCPQLSFFFGILRGGQACQEEQGESQESKFTKGRHGLAPVGSGCKSASWIDKRRCVSPMSVLTGCT